MYVPVSGNLKILVTWCICHPFFPSSIPLMSLPPSLSPSLPLSLPPSLSLFRSFRCSDPDDFERPFKESKMIDAHVNFIITIPPLPRGGLVRTHAPILSYSHSAI